MVILLNLLPHREAARRRRREVFQASLGASAVAGLLVAGGLYLWQAHQLASQEARNALLRNEIQRLDSQIRDIATLQTDIAALRVRQQSVEDLQADRNLPVHLLNDLVRLLPEGVYLTALRQDRQVVTLNGVAQTNERVSELLRNLGQGSPSLSRPELVEIVSGTVTLGPREQRRVANFTVRVSVGRAAEPARAGASAPASPSASAPAPVSSAPGAASPASPARS